MICEQCGGSGQVGPTFEDQFPCAECNGVGFDVRQVLTDLKWAMIFVSDLRYQEQKDNRDRILKYISEIESKVIPKGHSEGASRYSLIIFLVRAD